MGDALQYALGVPTFYVLWAATPFASYLNAVTAFGLGCLLVGLSLASYRGNAKALLFLISFLLNEAMVVCVFLFAGPGAGESVLWIILSFAIGHFFLVMWLMGPIDKMPAEIMLLGFHSIAYSGVAVWLAVEYVSRT